MHTTGTLIDNKYEIIDRLGVGGFGEVYSALHKQFERKVAIKLLNTTMLLEADGLARFEREAKAIAALTHKNIVAFYGYGAWQQAPYMVMELVEGKSLDKLLQTETQLEPQRVLRLMRQVFEALGSAHNIGVVHRDLKPSNIIITKDADGKETVKIIDFGLARLMPGYGVPGQKLTETGYAIGTARYMPPEQALGRVCDGRADIYAAGCIAYQLLAGKPPFDADENIALMFMHLNETPEPLSKILDTRAPIAAIATFINNCMAKNENDRYQTCADAIADLDAIIAGKTSAVTPLAVRPMEAQAAIKKPFASWKTVLALCCAAAFVLTASVFFWMQSQQRQRGADGQVNVIDSDTAAARMRQLKEIIERYIGRKDPQDRALLVKYIHELVDLRQNYRELNEVSDQELLSFSTVLDPYARSKVLKRMMNGKITNSRTTQNWARINLAKLYVQQGKDDKALDEYATAIELARDKADYLQIANIVDGYVSLGKMEDAAQLSKELEGYKSDGSWAAITIADSRARAALAAHDYDTALKFAAQAQEMVTDGNLNDVSPLFIRIAATGAKNGRAAASKLINSIDWDEIDPHWQKEQMMDWDYKEATQYAEPDSGLLLRSKRYRL